MVDNCKTAVIKPRRGDEKAELNSAYEEFARHYGFQIDPCNVR
jgi:transposase